MVKLVIRFGTVGVLATLTHYLVAVALLGLCGPYVSTLAGYIAAVAVSYVGHQRFTFQAKPDHKRHAGRFIVTSLVALAGSYLVLATTLAFGLDAWIGLGLSIGVMPVVTFFALQLWVFASHDSGNLT